MGGFINVMFILAIWEKYLQKTKKHGIFYDTYVGKKRKYTYYVKFATENERK